MFKLVLMLFLFLVVVVVLVEQAPVAIVGDGVVSMGGPQGPLVHGAIGAHAHLGLEGPHVQVEGETEEHEVDEGVQQEGSPERPLDVVPASKHSSSACQHCLHLQRC